MTISLSSCSEEKIIEDKKEVNKLELEVKLDTIKITEDGPKSYQIYKDQILIYEFIDFPSTGTETSFKLSSENLIIKDTLYRPITKSEKNLPGGDESKVTLIFQGKKSGTCQLQIKHMYRADLERIVSFGILIK
ncbi:MAG: hypothetical protein ACKO6J_01895 [Crocinitomicaceae bacterium]